MVEKNQSIAHKKKSHPPALIFLTLVLAEFVKVPAHDARPGRVLGPGNVFERAHHRFECLHQFPRQPLQLAVGQGVGVDDDAALGAAKGDVHDLGWDVGKSV